MTRHEINDKIALTTVTMTGATAVAVDLDLPAVRDEDAWYMVMAYNPSATRTLTVSIQNKFTPVATARYVEVTNFTASTTASGMKAVQGWMCGAGARLTFVYNDTGTDAVEYAVYRI